MRRALFSFLMFAAVILPARSHAADAPVVLTAPPLNPTAEVMLDVELGYLGVGGLVALTAWNPFVIEAGAGIGLFDKFYVLRAGYRHSFGTRDAEGRGKQLDLQALAGVRVLDNYDGFAGVTNTGTTAGINAAFGVGGTFWVARHFGIIVRGTAGLSFFPEPTTTSINSFTPEVGLNTGFAF